MDLREIIENTKIIIMDNGKEHIELELDGYKVYKNARKFSRIFKKQQIPIYSIQNDNQKIRIDELCTEYMVQKLIDNPSYISRAIKKDDLTLEIYTEIKSRFPNMRNDKIKELLLNYSLTEILEGGYSPTGRFHPKDIILSDTKDYLCNPELTIC